MNRLPPAIRAQALAMLVDGASMRAVTRVLGVAKQTVANLLVNAGTVSAAYHD